MCGFKIEEENKIEDKEKENQDKIPQEKRDNDDADDTDVTESEDEIRERRSKWDKKAEIGILLGYTDTGYSVIK